MALLDVDAAAPRLLEAARAEADSRFDIYPLLGRLKKPGPEVVELLTRVAKDEEEQEETEGRPSFLSASVSRVSLPFE